MWGIFLLTAILFAGRPVLAQPPDAKLEKAWSEVLNPNLLISADEFLRGDYVSALVYKIDQIQHNPALKAKLLPGLAGGSGLPKIDVIDKMPWPEQVFVYGGYLNWFLPHHRKRFFEQRNPTVASEETFTVRLAALAANDDFVAFVNSGKPITTADKDIYLSLAGYDPQVNSIFMEVRVKAPPAIWLEAIFHEERHSYDDIVSYSNQPPLVQSGSPLTPAMINFEIMGHANGLFVWKIVKADFLRRLDKSLHASRSYLPTKLMLENIKAMEKLFDKYCVGEQAPLEDEIRSILNRD